MTVVENAGAKVANGVDPDTPKNDAAVDHHHHQPQSSVKQKSTKPADQSFHMMVQKISPQQSSGQLYTINGNGVSKANIYGSNNQSHKKMNGEDDGSEGFKGGMRDLEKMLSKLNPMAQEFVPPSLGAGYQYHRLVVPLPQAAGHYGYNANGFLIQQHVNSGVPNGNSIRRKNDGYSQGKRRINSRTNMAQREEVIRRTVYVSDIDHQVTEEELAALFIGCGQVVDCRVCGDPNSVLRFAFIEFTDEEGARNALSLTGTMLGYYPVRVLPSKTAIAPVNPTFLPRSEDERKTCARTIYCTNIDKKVTQADVKLFFESNCGEVLRLRLLGDYIHLTRIAFVEFVMGNTAVYLLYAHARICSIIRKSGKDIEELKKVGKLELAHPDERVLGLHLLQFAETVEEACTNLLPNVLCEYLYNLSEDFTRINTNCQVVGSAEETSRLLLYEATAVVMRKCFHLLGITPVYKI